jgi:hypothetical protein
MPACGDVARGRMPCEDARMTLQARLIAYPPDGAAVQRWIPAGGSLRIGRAPDCGLVIEHPSVSRAHAEVRAGGDAWSVRDLNSKNGSFLDGTRVAEAPLSTLCWLRMGDVQCEFALFDPAHAAHAGLRAQTRRAQSELLIRELAGRQRIDGLLDDVLRGVLELSGCTRGFMLLADGGDYVVCASRSLEAGSIASRTFSGSVGAVERTLATRRAVAVNQVDSEPWLAGRASVVGLGLQSLVCVPLLDGERVLGAVYADRSEPGEPITQLDLELLGAFAESAAVYVLAGRAMAALEGAPRWNTIVSAHAGRGLRA